MKCFLCVEGNGCRKFLIKDEGGFVHCICKKCWDELEESKVGEK